MGSAENGPSVAFGNAGRDVTIDQSTHQTTHQTTVYADRPFGGTRAEATAAETRSGRVGAAELDGIRTGYVARPVDDRLVAALETDALVLLQGRRGWGRRAASLRALAAVTGDQVNVLDTFVPGDLTSTTYASGEGYFYDASQIPWAEADWSDGRIGVIRSRIAAAGAFLVVLLPGAAVRQDLPCRFDWTRIEVDELLAEAGFDPPLPDGAALVGGLVGTDAPVFEVARLIARLRQAQESGESIDDVVETFAGSRRGAIHDQLEAITDRDGAAMLICLAFLGGTSEIAFDTGHLDLLEALSDEDDEEERKATRQSRFGSRADLLERCGGQQLTASRAVARQQMEVPVIDLQQPGDAGVYIGELWRSRPNALRRDIILWLRRFIPILGGDDLVVAAQRIALLADVDLSLLVYEVLQPWADGTTYESFLAAGVLQMVADRGRDREAFQIAREWAQYPNESPRLLAATYFFAFTAPDQPENALVVFRRKSLRSPQRATRQAALDGWRHLATAAAGREATAATVTRYFAELKAVQKAELDDPVFILLDAWFAGGPKRRPLALGAAAQGPGCERRVAQVLSSVNARTHARVAWYRPLVGYLDSTPATSDLVERLIGASMRPLAPERRDYIAGVLLERVRRWNREKDGPSRVAVERAERIIRSHKPRRLT